MIKLGKMKKTLLEAAADRGDGALLLAPDGKDALSKARRRALEGLLKDGLAEERPTREADVVWREDDGARCSIYATAAGFTAVGTTPPAAAQRVAAETATKRPGRQTRSGARRG